MVEIITKEFILMGGTVDVVSTASAFPTSHHAGGQPLCPNTVTPSRAELVPWGALPGLHRAPGLLAPADPVCLVVA